MESCAKKKVLNKSKYILDLRFFKVALVWSGRELGGLSMFRFLCCVCVWPGMVLNQRQVSLVVSD